MTAIAAERALRLLVSPASSPRSICFFSDDYAPAKTGTGVSAATMARGLVRRGHRVLVLTSRRRGEPESETIDGVLVIRLFSIALFGFPQAMATPARIRALLLQHAVEIAHFHYLSVLSLIGARVARASGIACVFTHHMTVDHLTQPLPLRPFRPLFARLIRQFCSRMDIRTAPSRNFVEQHRGELPVPLEYLSNALPPFPAGARAFATSEQTDGTFIVLFAGRLDREKNLPFLIRAAALSMRQNPRLRLWLAGTGIEEMRLRLLVQKLGIDEQTRFLGWLAPAALADAYRSAGVFVLPSRVEMQGMVALEAMAFGKPLIMADSIITASEFITPGENGFIVKSDDHSQLAATLLAMSRDAEGVARMGANSRTRALAAEVTPEHIVERLEALYTRVGGRR